MVNSLVKLTDGNVSFTCTAIGGDVDLRHK